jgi:hypothetical protein
MASEPPLPPSLSRQYAMIESYPLPQQMLGPNIRQNLVSTGSKSKGPSKVFNCCDPSFIKSNNLFRESHPNERGCGIYSR